MAMKRCPVCGEEYSNTYKTCPFCEEEKALREGEGIRRSRGGRRSSRSRQFSLITPTLIVLILLMAALLVYLLYGDQLKEKLGKDQPEEDKPGTSEVIPEQPTPVQPDVQEPEGPDDPANTDQPGVIPEGPNTPNTPDTPAVTQPTEPETDYEKMMALPNGLSLSTTDFTLRTVGETAVIRASGGSGSYTWASEDEGVASVDQSGKVTAISRGTINVVVSDGSKKGVCIVRCNVSGTAAPSTAPPSTPAPAAPSTNTPSGGSALKAGAATVVNGGNGVRVRSGPGTNYEALATVPNGADIQVVESVGNDWYKITFSNVGGATTTGYMKGEFLKNK